jgi:uncharacterized protein YbjT (DUF2867 family)
MTKGLVTIFGGSGFIGRYAARELVKKAGECVWPAAG